MRTTNPDNARAPSVSTADPTGVRPVPPRLLVVVAHSDAHLRERLARSLAGEGYEVAQVTDGHELVVRLASWTMELRAADLFVLGEDLGRWSGVEIAAGLRGTYWEAPVVAVLDGAEGRHAPAVPGADAVFLQPFSDEDLCTAARALIDDGRRRATFRSLLAS